MAKFTLVMETNNATFEQPGCEAEIARILRNVADQVEVGKNQGAVVDINGNKVGTFWCEED